MPLSIKSTVYAISNGSPSNTLGAHSAGDLLIAFAAGENPSATSGWTTLATASATWAYDTYTCVYRIATSSSTSAPFSYNPSYYRSYVIGGAKATAPIAASATGQLPAWSWASAATVPAITVPAGGLRLTALQGYGAGGNPWNTLYDFGVITSSDTSFTRINGYNHVFLEGGSSSFSVLQAPGYQGGGGLAWVTLSIQPEAASGFFAMF